MGTAATDEHPANDRNFPPRQVGNSATLPRGFFSARQGEFMTTGVTSMGVDDHDLCRRPGESPGLAGARGRGVLIAQNRRLAEDRAESGASERPTKLTAWVGRTSRGPPQYETEEEGE